MTEGMDLSVAEKDRLLWRLWKRRQLNSVVLLVLLIVLYFLASDRGFGKIAQITLYGIFAMPLFAGVIAWWDVHWLWKNQERMLKLLGRTETR
jgi:hypothetical protein